MKPILLDTNIIIDLFAQEESVVSTIEKLHEHPFSVSVISEAEYYYGAYRSHNTDHQISIYQSFLHKMNVSVLSITSDVSKLFARLQADFSMVGKKKPVFDLYIAATCIAHEITLVTNNVKDFSEIPGLDLYTFR